MPYHTPFHGFIFADETGRPSLTRYRIALSDGQDRLAVVHIDHTGHRDQNPLTSSVVRDRILNRILDNDLRGVPVNFIRLVVESDGTSSVFAIEVDIDDYIARGNPFDSTRVATAGGMLQERIAIRSAAVIAGSARVSTIHAAPMPVPADISDALK
jgi:hypothetical protein